MASWLFLLAVSFLLCGDLYSDANVNEDLLK